MYLFLLCFDLLLYVHGKQLGSCRDSPLLNRTVPRQVSRRQFTSISNALANITRGLIGQVGFFKKSRLGDLTLHKDGDKLAKPTFFL